MTKFWSYVLHVAAGLLLVAAAVVLLGMAAPFLSDSLRRIATEYDTDSGQSGLIYVESPEVYTRQRLVNDRYLQDAWLRRKLQEIESEDAIWVDTLRRSRDSATVDLSAIGSTDPGDGQTASTTVSDLESVQLSFEDEFALQSNARDTIRQMILENALDDRHDLSGNTVFGLKFDTSILPGSRARLNPTVIVNMEANPLESLTLPASLHAAYFNKSGWADTSGISDQDLSLLRLIDGHFISWKENLEERLNRQRSIIANADRRTDRRACSRTADVNQALLRRPLCDRRPADVRTGPTALVVSPEAEQGLFQLLAQRRAIDGALSYVMRLPNRKIDIGARFREDLMADADAYCAMVDRTLAQGPEVAPSMPHWFLSAADETVRAQAYVDALQSTALGDFLGPRPLNGDVPSRWFELASPWAPLFQFVLDWRISDEQDSCGAEIEIMLNPLEIPILFLPNSTGGDDQMFLSSLNTTGLTPLTCDASICTDNGFSVWVADKYVEAARDALDEATLAQLITSVRPESADEQLCFGPGYYYQLDDADPFEDEECRPGLLATFRIGAYHFMRKMTLVESYTYAAFPRGDVSGVVTETGSQRSGGAGFGSDAGSGALRFGTDTLERTTDAQPSLINFAAGDRHELFDFGWSIAKEGVKQPMIASQLVLVSVPAYLDEINLEIVKGFLDVDKLPRSWDQRRADYAELICLLSAETPADCAAPGAGRMENGGVLSEEISDARYRLLQTRVEQLFEGYERRAIRLKVPPDYGALDGVVIGNNILGGPSINTAELQPCYQAVDAKTLTMAIPGERLWRSTVVTLAGNKATQIEVMPDMRGILARFEAFTRPGNATTSQLTVWTSEGSDDQTIRFCE